MGAVLKNAPEAEGLSGRQAEEIPFIYLFFFNFLRESMYLMAQKVVWLPRQAAAEEGGRQGWQLAGLSCVTLRTEGAQHRGALTKCRGPVQGIHILIKKSV